MGFGPWAPNIIDTVNMADGYPVEGEGLGGDWFFSVPFSAATWSKWDPWDPCLLEKLPDWQSACQATSDIHAKMFHWASPPSPKCLSAR